MNRIRVSLAFVGALQGLALWLLRQRWPTAQPALAGAVALLCFLVASALVVHFAATGRNPGRLAAAAVVTGVLFGAVGAWLGLQLPPSGTPAFGDDQRIWTWALAGPAALYTFGPFIQIFQATGRARFPYPQLYVHAWNNFFVAALGATFAGALWTVLILWGQLFALLGIDLFEDFFAKSFVVYVTSGAALGYGLALGRESEHTTSSLRGLTQLLFRVLLPLLSAVTLAFLATLATTGITRLYATQRAAWIMLAWVVGYLVLFNAVYQDGAGERPYTIVVRRIVEAAAFTMPAMAAIALHALWLRINQHGLTPDRMWALVAGAILMLYALGYAGAVPSRGARWMPGVGGVNIALAVVVVAVALAMHSPLLDPLAWSAGSQVRRVESGSVSAIDFDYGFLRFHLGHAGAEALERLQGSASAADADLIRDGVVAVLQAQQESEWRARLGPRFNAERFERHPAGSPWPDGLLEAIGRESTDRRFAGCGRTATCVVFDADLDADGTPEALVAGAGERERPKLINVGVFQRTENGWRLVGWMMPEAQGTPAVVDDTLAAIRVDRIEVVAPRHHDLLIDGRRFRLVESPR